jgi:hypothetical protein
MGWEEAALPALVRPPPREDDEMLSLLRSWARVVAWPSTRVFSACEGRSAFRTFVGLVLGGGSGLVLSLGLNRLLAAPGSEYQGLAAAWVERGTQAPWASWQALVPLGVLSGFYSYQVLLWVIARLLGGGGSFGSQAYLQSLFYAPLALVQQVLIGLPHVGRAAFAAVALWSLIPSTTSLKAAHGLSTARSVATWLAPIALNVVVTVVIVALAARR